MDGREEMVSEHRALCLLAQMALDCAAAKRKNKEEAKATLAYLSEPAQVIALCLELLTASDVGII